jgi:hypothetical protein
MRVWRGRWEKRFGWLLGLFLLGMDGGFVGLAEFFRGIVAGILDRGNVEVDGLGGGCYSTLLFV